MPNDLKIPELIKKNPRLNQADLDKILKVVEESKRLGFTPTTHRLATPMTPRQRPPVDHDNRTAGIKRHEGVSRILAFTGSPR